MEHLLDHPALVMGVPPRSKNAKPMLVTMTTMVQIENIGSDEMVQLPSAYGLEVLAYGGNFYAPAECDLSDLVKSSWDDGGVKGSHITTPGIDALNEMAERYHGQKERDFWPTSMAHMLHWGVRRYATETFPRCIDRASHIGDFKKADMFQSDSVQRWRECAQEFADNLKMVDGKLFVRRHEPMLLATKQGIGIHDTGMYDRFVNRRLTDGDQFLIRSPTVAGGNAFALRDFDEAVAFAINECGWVPDDLNGLEALTGFAELECTDTDTILIKETERLADGLLSGWKAFRESLKDRLTWDRMDAIPKRLQDNLIYCSPEWSLAGALAKLRANEGCSEGVMSLAQDIQDIASQIAACLREEMPYSFSAVSEALRLHVVRLENAPINLQPSSTKPIR